MIFSWILDDSPSDAATCAELSVKLCIVSSVFSRQIWAEIIKLN